MHSLVILYVTESFHHTHTLCLLKCCNIDIYLISKWHISMRFAGVDILSSRHLVAVELNLDRI